MAFRIDTSGTLRPPRFTADGRLRVDAHLTRTGVFTYRQPDGTLRREYRPPEEVFDAESLASFEQLPVTDEHPPAMLTDETRTQYTRGSTGDVVTKDEDGRHMKSSIVVFDAKLVADMKSRKKTDVSNGYTCDLDETPGTSPDGEQYDVVQRKIRGNHVAIVARGRAGTARVRMDAAVMVDDNAGERPHHFDGVTVDELKKAIEEAAAQKARADQAEQALTRVTAERDDARRERDEQRQARTDADSAHDAAVKKAREDAYAEASERLAVEAKAREILGPDKDGKARKFDGVETRAIKLEVISHVSKRDSSKESDPMVAARYDVAVESHASGRSGAAATHAAVGTGEHARVGNVEAQKMREMRASYANAWNKTPKES